MPKIRILVVEDNDLHFFKVEANLEDLGYELAGRAMESDEVIRLLKATDPDVVLMDVQLVGEKSGIEISEHIKSFSDVPIIFITSSKDLETIKLAVKTDPSGYLIKPVTPEALQAAVELALYKFTEKNSNVSEKLTDTFFVKVDDGITQVKVDDIIWIGASSQEKYVDIQTNESNYLVRLSLKKISEKLPDQFLRISSSHVVNSKKIVKINEDLMTLIVDEHELRMSRKYKTELKDKLNFLT